MLRNRLEAEKLQGFSTFWGRVQVWTLGGALLYYRNSFHSSHAIFHACCPSLVSLQNSNIPLNTKPASVSANVTTYAAFSSNDKQLLCWAILTGERCVPTMLNIFALLCFCCLQTLEITEGSGTLCSSRKQLWLLSFFFISFDALWKHKHGQDLRKFQSKNWDITEIENRAFK